VNPTPAHPKKKMGRHSVESSHCSGSLQKNVSQRDSTLSIFCASHSASTDCLFWYLSWPKNRSSCSPQNKKERGQITEKRGASKSMEKYEMSSRILRSASKSMQKHPRCFEDSMRSDQMFANVCSYAQCESVRQTVLAASIQNRKKDDSRETPEIASMRRSVLAELFTHSWRCISTSCVVQDILRRPALVSVSSESRLTFSSQLRQSLKIPNRGQSTTTLGRSAVCYAGRAGAEGRM